MFISKQMVKRVFAQFHVKINKLYNTVCIIQFAFLLLVSRINVDMKNVRFYVLLMYLWWRIIEYVSLNLRFDSGDAWPILDLFKNFHLESCCKNRIRLIERFPMIPKSLKCLKLAEKNFFKSHSVLYKWLSKNLKRVMVDLLQPLDAQRGVTSLAKKKYRLHTHSQWTMYRIVRNTP